MHTEEIQRAAAPDSPEQPHPYPTGNEYGYDVLATDRLCLRPFRADDVDDFYACCRNPHLGDQAGWQPHASLEESRQVLQQVFLQQAGVWAVVFKDEDRVIGSVGLVPDPARDNPRVRMLGYWLREDLWGRGLMSEAVAAVVRYGFDTWGLDGISANCYPHNRRSGRLLQRQGFAYEGTLRAATLTYDNRVYDCMYFFLSREPYDQGTTD